MAFYLWTRAKMDLRKLGSEGSQLGHYYRAVERVLVEMGWKVLTHTASRGSWQGCWKVCAVCAIPVWLTAPRYRFHLVFSWFSWWVGTEANTKFSFCSNSCLLSIKLETFAFSKQTFSSTNYTWKENWPWLLPLKHHHCILGDLSCLKICICFYSYSIKLSHNRSSSQLVKIK